MAARPGRRRVRTAAGLASLLLLLGAQGCSGQDDPEDERSPEAPGSTTSAEPDAATPSPGTSVDPDSLAPETRKAVVEGGDDYYAVLNDVLGDPDGTDPGKPDELAGVTGAALAEMLNTVTEYQENGWRVEGRARVLRQRVVSATEDPDQVVVRACVDNSDVRVVDSNGDEVPNSRPPRPRTRYVLTLVRDGGSWVVATQRPTTRPNC